MIRRQFVLEADFATVAGQDVTVFQPLDADLDALRPVSFSFNESDGGWAIVDLRIGTIQLIDRMTPCDRVDEVVRLNGGYPTIQRRMEVSITARYQGKGRATLRCVVDGFAV